MRISGESSTAEPPDGDRRHVTAALRIFIITLDAGPGALQVKDGAAPAAEIYGAAMPSVT